MKIEDNELMEKLIIKGLYTNKHFCSLIVSALDKKLFDSNEAAKLYSKINEYFRKYKDIPDKNLIINMFDEKDREAIYQYQKEIDSFEFDIEKNMNFLIDQTDDWLKGASLKNAILDSVKIIEKGDSDNYNKISSLVKEALCRTVKFDVGVDYFNTLGSRLQKMFNLVEYKVPSCYPSLDEFTAGGFPPATLSIGLAKSHMGKCLGKMNKIKIRNRKNNKIEDVQIGEFVNRFVDANDFIKVIKECKQIKELFNKKYGNYGEEKWKKWITMQVKNLKENSLKNDFMLL